jgi:hypothetical protein
MPGNALINLIRRDRLLQLVNQMDGLDSEHKSLMFDKFVKLGVNDSFEPGLIIDRP